MQGEVDRQDESRRGRESDRDEARQEEKGRTEKLEKEVEVLKEMLEKQAMHFKSEYWGGGEAKEGRARIGKKEDEDRTEDALRSFPIVLYPDCRNQQ